MAVAAAFSYRGEPTSPRSLCASPSASTHGAPPWSPPPPHSARSAPTASRTTSYRGLRRLAMSFPPRCRSNPCRFCCPARIAFSSRRLREDAGLPLVRLLRHRLQQVTKVARLLAAKACTVMALLDGGMLKRQKSWVKGDVVHVHVHPVQPMPSHLCHKYVICTKKERLHVLLSLLERDAPKSGIIFVAEQSERSKKAGNPPPTTVVAEFLRNAYKGSLDVLLLEEDVNFNARAASFSEVKGRGFLLVSTDIASRGFDLPQTSHVYNFDLPKTATDYLHHAGRTGREPLQPL